MKRELRMQKWSAQIEVQQASGLTVQEWCMENGVNPTTYYYHLNSAGTIPRFFFGNRSIKRTAAAFRYPNCICRRARALPQISVLILTPSPSIWLPKAYTHIFRTLYVSPF
jgi:hypothetical protein